MKAIERVFLSFLGGFFCMAGLFAQAPAARDYIQKANDKIQGEESSYAEMSMTIVRPSWERTVRFQSWTLGTEYAMTLVTAPARDKGQSFLKRGNEMWNWNPTIRRLIKLPPAMMSQGWMGSDYTNDDILKESSILDDYTHELLGEEMIDGRSCVKIKMTAKPDANVIWGHQVRWVDQEEYLFLKVELYDEDGFLMRTELGKDLKTMGGRFIPSRMEIIPEEEEGQKTVVVIEKMRFNDPLPESFFSQQRMKTLR